MKAALLEAVRHLKIIDTEAPQLTGPDQVLVRVSKVGICGSELHAFVGTHPYRKPPVILGHEMSGVIVACGADVTDYVPGQRVYIDPQWTCGQCEWCRAGVINLCLNKKVMGTPDWPGAFGERIIAPVESVFALPDTVNDVQGFLVEPLAVGVHAVNQANVQPGQSVLVLGSGPIGSMVTAMARVRGATTIIAVDRHDHCLDVACELGATHRVRADDLRILDQVRRIVGERGVDVAILAAGEPVLADVALAAVRKRGTLEHLALFDVPTLALNPYEIIRKELHMVGSLMSDKRDIQEAIDLVASGKVNPEPMARPLLPIDDIQHGFEIAESKAEGAVKVTLTFPG